MSRRITENNERTAEFDQRLQKIRLMDFAKLVCWRGVKSLCAAIIVHGGIGAAAWGQIVHLRTVCD
jgi:hypothetical protein